jgi:hypothetical protein
MSASDTVQTIISNAQTAANTAQAKAIAYADAAKTAADGGLILVPLYEPERPTVTVLPFAPTEDLSTLFNSIVGNLDPAFKTDFANKASDFLATWFPDFANCLKTNVDGWICTTIAGGITGIPNAVESQIWERSRNKEIKESNRIKIEAAEAFASRGWNLPGGVLYAQLAMIDQEAANKVSTHNRDVAIKQVDVQIENVRFAVQMGVQLRLGVVQALIGYLNAFLKIFDLATERAKTQAELKRSLWEATAAYYRALIDVAQLTLEFEKLKVDRSVAAQTNDVKNNITQTEGRVNAAVSAAAEMGKIAQAALSAQNTLAEIGSQTITSS